MPAERTPKVNGAATRQPAPAKQPRSNGGGKRQARGGGKVGTNKPQGGGAKKRGPQRLVEYEAPHYSQAESLYFADTAIWCDLATKLARPGIKHLTFGPDFRVSE